MTIAENIALAETRWQSARAAQRAAELIERFDIRAQSPLQRAGSLSGGNQQKVILARELERQPEIIVAAEPTRGLDIEATRFVHDELRAAAARGAAILLITSDLDEAFALGDAIHVIYRGRLSARMTPDEAASQRAPMLMAGVEYVRTRLVIAAIAARRCVAIALLALCGIAFGHSPASCSRSSSAARSDRRSRCEGTLLKSIPLLLTGLSVAIAFRAGVWNIGGEGQFLAGALGAFLGARYGMIAALAASLIAGAIWASIASAMRLWRNAPEVLTTILLNFIAIHLLGYARQRTAAGSERQVSAERRDADRRRCCRRSARASCTPASSSPSSPRSPPGFCSIEPPKDCACARADSIAAPRSGPASTSTRRLVRAMAISGAMAGLAGGIELLGVTHRLFERFAAGYGYAGIAVALLAQLHPLGTLASAFFFGALTTGAGELQRTRGHLIDRRDVRPGDRDPGDDRLRRAQAASAMTRR